MDDLGATPPHFGKSPCTPKLGESHDKAQPLIPFPDQKEAVSYSSETPREPGFISRDSCMVLLYF